MAILMICQLDRSNLANAYVSGMKTDLGFSGNQFNVVNTVFTVGYTSYYYLFNYYLFM